MLNIPKKVYIVQFITRKKVNLKLNIQSHVQTHVSLHKNIMVEQNISILMRFTRDTIEHGG